MKIKNILILFLLLSFPAVLSAQETYVRTGQKLDMSLEWTTDNYGTIQWQKSTDGGVTWTDIAGADGPDYSTAVSTETMFRARVSGDPSCPPIDIERKVKLVSFDTSVDEVGWNYADMTVSNLNLNGADVVEYGFCEGLTALARTYSMLPLVKVGGSLPEGSSFTMRCGGLLPKTSYYLRLYIKTADGSVIFGPGKITTTIDGLAWQTEGWTIEKRRIRGVFTINGNANVTDVKCSYGPSLNELTEVSVTNSNGVYTTGYMAGTPATTYVLKVSAVVDGEEQVLTKEIRTLPDYSDVAVDATVKPVSHRINWGIPRTLVRITPDNLPAAEYPRIARINDNDLILTYHGGTPADHWQNSYYRLSHDNGRTWGAQIMLFDKSKTFLGSGYWRICNPQATVLDNGWIIVSATGNANPETNNNCKVICTVSKDKGQTWSDLVVVCRGRNWEPHVVQLPGGELELLVSSEAKWWGKGGNLDQEIVSCISTDYGQTWTTPVRASYSSGARDGMPVPILMQGNKGVMFTIESPAGGYAPSVVHRSLTQSWETTSWDRVNDSRRWASGLNGGGGGPYSVQLPTGEIVMSCHTNQVGSVWQTCRPQVVMTDNTGHNPKYITLPVTTNNPLKANEGAYYNSLWVKDAEHIWLLVTRATYNGDKRGASSIEYIEGTIVPVN